MRNNKATGHWKAALWSAVSISISRNLHQNTVGSQTLPSVPLQPVFHLFCRKPLRPTKLGLCFFIDLPILAHWGKFFLQSIFTDFNIAGGSGSHFMQAVSHIKLNCSQTMLRVPVNSESVNILAHNLAMHFHGSDGRSGLATGFVQLTFNPLTLHVSALRYICSQALTL